VLQKFKKGTILNYKTKKEYRENAKSLRLRLNMPIISSKICSLIKKQAFYKFKNILIFYPFNNEVDLRNLANDRSKQWYLPRVDLISKSIVIHKYTSDNDLIKNKWGICEPPCNSEEVDINIIDVVMIPALMADKNGHRLGYGAGYYDKFLPKLRKECIKVVPIPEELFIDSLPADHWDIPFDVAVTQKSVYYIKQVIQ